MDTFKDNLKSNALNRLQQNKARLDQSQQRYQNTDPKNPNWAFLRQRSAQVRDLNARSQQSVKTATGDLSQSHRRPDRFPLSTAGKYD